MHSLIKQVHASFGAVSLCIAFVGFVRHLTNVERREHDAYVRQGTLRRCDARATQPGQVDADQLSGLPGERDKPQRMSHEPPSCAGNHTGTSYTHVRVLPAAQQMLSVKCLSKWRLPCRCAACQPARQGAVPAAAGSTHFPLPRRHVPRLPRRRTARRARACTVTRRCRATLQGTSYA